MWFLFGFITLLSFSVYAGYKRLNATWKGDPGVRGRHHYKVLRNKRGITGLLVGISGGRGYDFALKREAWYDRLGKALGLSEEHQTGNPVFDELVYIVSDDRQLQQQVTGNAELVATVIKLFALADDYHGKMQELRCNSGRLWIKIGAGKGFAEERIDELAAHAGQLLQKCAAQLPPPEPAPGRWRDPFVLKAALLLALSSGLAFNGIAHLVRLNWSSIPYTVDEQQLFTHALLCGAVVVAVLIVAAIVLLGRSARTHLVLIELCTIGLFGATTTAGIELRDMNMELDSSRAVEYRVQVSDKHVSRSRRSTRYQLCLQDWNGSGEKQHLRVSHALYDQTAIGATMLVRQKDGYFHYRWVASIEQAPPANAW